MAKKPSRTYAKVVTSEALSEGGNRIDAVGGGLRAAQRRRLGPAAPEPAQEHQVDDGEGGEQGAGGHRGRQHRRLTHRTYGVLGAEPALDQPGLAAALAEEPARQHRDVR